MVLTYSNTAEKRIVKVNNKVIGHFERNTFIKSVIGSKHKLRCPEAWAIDAEVFDTDVLFEATTFVVLDKETDTEYHCTVKAFNRLKGTIDRGWGRQYFLPLKHWEVRENRCIQLSLFGGDQW